LLLRSEAAPSSAQGETNRGETNDGEITIYDWGLILRLDRLGATAR